MNQVFYIDTDEEISSIIDKLNKSMSGDNFFVVPKRALFLQSVVNLKLLKREADKIGKRITLITQDEIGVSMAQKAEINTRPSMDGFEQDQNPGGIMRPEDNYEESAGLPDYDGNPAVSLEKNMNKSSRLSNVGTEDYYSSLSQPRPDKEIISDKKISEVSRYGEEVFPDTKSQVRYAGNDAQKPKIFRTIDTKRQAYVKTAPKVPAGNSPKQAPYRKQLDPYKERVLEKIFSKSKEESFSRPVAVDEKRGLIKKISLIFAAVCILSLVGVAIYLFVPAAKVIITPNIAKSRISLDIGGKSNPDAAEASTIPIRIMAEEEIISLQFEVQGKSAAGKKAHGSIVIYNEFSSAAQPLVATTRFEAPDGKIFRLVRGVSVPGTTTVGGEAKPGAIEVEVVADQPGPDYNIEPANFKIPGFKDGPKYEKFYAKSTAAMTGGASDGDASGPSTVTQTDIDKAKEKVQEALEEKIAEIIKNGLKEGEVSPEQARKISITKISAAAKTGQALASFDCSATASFSAMVFSTNDVEKIVQNSLQEKEQAGYKQKIGSIEYATIEPDFEKSSLGLKVHGEVIAEPVIDVDKIKKEILGKNADQLGEILRKYPSIKNVNVEFQPVFISRVPQYEKKVNIEIVENE